MVALPRCVRRPSYGLNFEVGETDCWHNPETSVFVSKSGQNQKTLLFAYASRSVPTITPVDERTVRIGLGDIDHIFCRSVSWKVSRSNTVLAPFDLPEVILSRDNARNPMIALLVGTVLSLLLHRSLYRVASSVRVRVRVRVVGDVAAN